MIPGDLLSAFPHRQFHTLPGLLDSRAALPNSYPSALRAMQGGSLYHSYYGLWYDPAERRTHNLPCERWTRYRLSQPDTVLTLKASQVNNRVLLIPNLFITIFCILTCREHTKLTVLCSSPSLTLKLCSKIEYMMRPIPNEGSITLGVNSSTVQDIKTQNDCLSIKIRKHGPRFTKNLKSDRNRKHISGAKMRFTKIIIL